MNLDQYPTPRTDALYLNGGDPFRHVAYEHARQLEREKAVLREALEKIAEINSGLSALDCYTIARTALAQTKGDA